MTLTNRELASNPTFPIAATLLACPRCNYISNSEELTDPQIPCPKCNTQGVTRHIFPDVSGIELLEMIAYFYAGACNGVENLQTELVNDLWDKVGRTYDALLLIDTAREVQSFYQKSGRGKDDYSEMLEIIRKHLCLTSGEDAQRVFATLFRYSETFEEHKVVTILTCTLLEKLFDDLLVLLYTSEGMDHLKAERKVGRLRGFDERSKTFQSSTGLSLKDAIGQYSIPNFFSDWGEVRDRRNKFLHGNPFSIGVPTTEKAFNLAQNAFSLFAHLQNLFCVRRTLG